ncbi:MAG TPA: DUF6632 domain-containing protein [Gemmatimonadales bacterium]|nr:DUF6632 domain-containing protein [Gemmatimonadales bacterium]
MTAPSRVNALRYAMIGTGVICSFLLFPLTRLWPGGWSWGMGASHYLPMILVVYFVLGISLIFASRDPVGNRALVWFTIWSNVAHSAVMAFQSTTDPAEVGHFFGDIPALLIVALVLAILLKRATIPAEIVAEYARRSA